MEYVGEVVRRQVAERREQRYRDCRIKVRHHTANQSSSSHHPSTRHSSRTEGGGGGIYSLAVSPPPHRCLGAACVCAQDLYQFSLGGSGEEVLDATRKGNVARLINHSCMPNLRAALVQPLLGPQQGGRARVVLIAKRVRAAGRARRRRRRRRRIMVKVLWG